MIFDRVRERLRTTGRGEIGAAVNAAVTDTLGRTIITSGQTLAAVLALYLFGGTVLQGFAFTLLVGIVAGHVVHGVRGGAGRGAVGAATTARETAQREDGRT